MPLLAQPPDVLRLLVFTGIDGIRRVAQRLPPEAVGAVVREQMQFSRHPGVISGVRQTLRQPFNAVAAVSPVLDRAAARRKASALQCRAGRAADRRGSVTGAEQNAVLRQPVEVRRHAGKPAGAAQRIEPVLICHDPENMRPLHIGSPAFPNPSFFQAAAAERTLRKRLPQLFAQRGYSAFIIAPNTKKSTLYPQFYGVFT